jgi:hypothetical protein
MDDLDAILLIEDSESHEIEEYLEAWATLLRSGTVWRLQGFYQRGIRRLVEDGLISPDGKVLLEESSDH